MSEIYQRISRHGPSTRPHEQEVEETLTYVIDENPGITRAQMVIQYFIGFLNSLLLLRFLLALFGANPENVFVTLVYTITAPFTVPFRGLFEIHATAGSARFEMETLVAVIFYTLLSMAAIRLLDIFRK